MHRSNPLADASDEQLEKLAKAALEGHRKGANVLGPFSGHAVAVEQMRRKLYPLKRT